MATKKRQAPALFNETAPDKVLEPFAQRKATNSLRIRLDDMKTIQAKTDKQKDFFDAYRSGHYFVSLHGVAGTGKTYCAMYKALEDVLDKSTPYDKLVIVRSSVQGREMGHLPGSVDEKMSMFIEPYKQIAADLFGRKDAWDRLVEQGHIEFISTSFIRGTTFNNAILLLDEAQNCNFHELDTIITRVGHTSKFIICGDYRQADLRKKEDKSGLLPFLDIISTMKDFTHVEFGIDDIVRSSLVKNYILAKLKWEDRQ
jgi:phosphate starvation-inducible protein PhoH